MKDVKFQNNLFSQLDEKVYKVKYIDEPSDSKKRHFNLEEFIDKAKEVKKTFKDEDLFRLRPSLGTE